MKTIKKIVSVVLVAVMMLTLLTAFTSCKKDEEPTPPTGIDISGYKIIRSDNASYELTKFVTLFKQETTRYTKADLAVDSDYNTTGDGVKEILIGQTNRAESVSAMSALAAAPDNAYAIQATDDKIVIAAKSDDGVIRAMKYFLMTYAAPTQTEKYVTITAGTVDTGTVDLDSLIFDNFTEMSTQITSTIATGMKDFQSNCGYETLIQLNHNGDNNGTLFASFAIYGQNGYRIYKSTDNGVTWEWISTADDFYNNNMSDKNNPTTHKSTGWCLQPCLYELPCDMGDFKEGTLFLGACSTGNGYYKGIVTKTSSMTLYYSTDLGKSWTAYCNVDIAGDAESQTGVWEPFFMYDDATGRVYCYYSDESDEAGTKVGPSAQKLVYKYTTDMKTWVGKDGKTNVTADPFDAVSGSNPEYRPGMPSVTKMGNGKYFMTYEICGYTENGKKGCPIFYSISDSIDWKNIDGFGEYGKILQTSDGYQLGSSPWCAWTPAGGECGTLIIVANHNRTLDPITKDENGNKKGTDMIISFDYGETFIRIENPIPYYTFEKTAYSPFLGFSADGNTLFYINNPPDDKTKSFQRVIFKSIKIW